MTRSASRPLRMLAVAPGDERTIVGVVDAEATIAGTIECTENR